MEKKILHYKIEFQRRRNSLRSKDKILEMYKHCMNKVKKKNVMRRAIGGE
jgi:hypothetical protein